MRVLGLIPARGGSKGIKRKNMQKINNKTLIEIAYLNAKESKRIDKIIISTDCMEIYEESKRLGAEPAFIRPKEYATDDASSASVAKHALDYFANNDELFEICVLLQPTNPLRTTKMIDDTIEKLIQGSTDSAVTVVDVNANHPHRMYSISGKDRLSALIESDNPQQARQKLPKYYIRSGDVYACWVDTLNKYDNFIGKVSKAVIVKEQETVNIDTLIDLEIARLKLDNQ